MAKTWSTDPVSSGSNEGLSRVTTSIDYTDDGPVGKIMLEEVPSGYRAIGLVSAAELATLITHLTEMHHALVLLEDYA
jgi:hypothetical protein